MPSAVSFELTNHCNLKCPECASGSGTMKRARGYMDAGLFQRVAGELEPYLRLINLFFQGEPMLHPQFFSFARPVGKARIVVSTNGHFLHPENCEKIARSGIGKLIVSLDGMDQETYARYRINGDLATVMAGIKNAAAAIRQFNPALELEVQFLVNKYNQLQIPEAQEFAGSVDARLKLKSMQVRRDEDMQNWMPDNETYRRYARAGNIHTIKSALPDRCLRLWHHPVITWDGKVIPCCFDKDAEFVMGDLNRDSFRSIWSNKAYHDFRLRVLADRKSIPICRNCTSGLKGAE